MNVFHHFLLSLKEYYDNPGIFDSSDARLSEQISTDNKYSVVLVYGKGIDAITQLKSSVGVGTSIVGAGIAGAGITTVALVVVGVSPIGWVSAGIVGLGALASSGIAFFYPRDVEWAAFVFLQPHSRETFKRLGCDWYPAIQQES